MLVRQTFNLSRRQFSAMSVAQEMQDIPATTPSAKTYGASKSTTLPSGLTVLTSPNSSSTTVTYTTPNGSSSESGASLASRYMSFMGSNLGSTLKTHRTLEDAGATTFHSHTRTSTSRGFTCSPEDASSLLEFLSAKPTFEPWDVKTAIDQSKLDGEESKTSPILTLQEAIYSASFGESSSMGQTIYATPSAASVESFINRTFTGGIVTASGIADHDSFVRDVTNSFSGCDGGAKSTPASFVAGDSRVHGDTEFAHIAFTFNSTSLAHGLVLKSFFDSLGYSGFSANGIAGVYASGEGGSIFDDLAKAVKSEMNLDAVKKAVKSEIIFGTEGGRELSQFMAMHGKSPEEVCKEVEGVKGGDLGKASVAAVGNIGGVGGVGICKGV
ncbi:hypothetical protein TL16_g12881 [Triparma laevis f. inornata]|uniref:Uncharacterized protein n=1 Tax=Triparma laevis f. inornata TaxID=1714386 RepID=A0A9W7BN68_9STRA|nr:hypothetical protein TL16_g12881 [Triparma laevis f. inornata]